MVWDFYILPIVNISVILFDIVHGWWYNIYDKVNMTPCLYQYFT